MCVGRSTAGGRDEETLDHSVDLYDGVTLNHDLMGFARKGSVGAEIFRERIETSLRVWKGEGRRGVWLKIPREAGILIPEALEAGFHFHHTFDNHLVLATWLDGPWQQSRLPPAPTHYLGVAGFVLNSRREVLAVQEKTGPAAKAGIWKLPGGLADRHENLSDAAVREVKEETGIDCSFVSLIGMVEFHTKTGPTNVAREGTSDLYSVCVLRVLDERQEITPQPEEISACKWIPAEDLLQSSKMYEKGTLFGDLFRRALYTSESFLETQEEGSTGLGSGEFSLGWRDGKVSALMSHL